MFFNELCSLLYVVSSNVVCMPLLILLHLRLTQPKVIVMELTHSNTFRRNLCPGFFEYSTVNASIGSGGIRITVAKEI